MGRGKHSQRRRLPWVLFAVAAVVVVTAIVVALGARCKDRNVIPVAAKAAAPAPAETTVTATKPETTTVPAPPPDKKLRLVAVGDIMFDRRVSLMMQKNGSDWPFANTAALLREGELTFANLESPLAVGGTRLVGKSVTLRGTPLAVNSIKDAGIDVVSLANNHTFDYGVPAFQETIANLDGAGIRYVGAGLNSQEAFRPLSVETTSSVKVGFLALSGIAVPSPFAPGPNKPGVATGLGDRGMIATQIAEAKKTSDFVIVSVHWGAEYQYVPIRAQTDFAHFLVDQGADVVLGHHPHVMQGMELYKEKLIAYSLGNLVFDRFRVITGESLILRTEISREGLQAVEIVPVLISYQGQPSVATGPAAARIMGRMAQLSPSLAAPSIENDRFVWRRK